MSDQLIRPLPPGELLGEDAPPLFVPALELKGWAVRSFIEPGGPLTNWEHEHLQDATIGFLWTNVPCKRKGNVVAATAELPTIGGTPWVRARMEQQLREWFSEELDFLITVDATLARMMSNRGFCALMEHELYHCSVKLSRWGDPIYQPNGKPLYCIRGHDVEEFVGVVERYGPVLGETSRLVRAALNAPSVRPEEIAAACGTCLR